MIDKRIEVAAKALAAKNFEFHGPKGATWDNQPGYVRDGFRLEAAKILAVLDAVLPGALRVGRKESPLSVKLEGKSD